MRYTKAEAKYRYPQCCCGYCCHSYQSTAGDYQCKTLIAGNTIDIGGVCDYFNSPSEQKDEGDRPMYHDAYADACDEGVYDVI